MPNQDRNDAWTLDPLGNPTALAAAIDPESTSVNSQNQITQRKVGTSAASGYMDDFSADTSGAVDGQHRGKF